MQSSIILLHFGHFHMDIKIKYSILYNDDEFLIIFYADG
jgi:hypothetical protein